MNEFFDGLSSVVKTVVIAVAVVVVTIILMTGIIFGMAIG